MTAPQPRPRPSRTTLRLFDPCIGNCRHRPTAVDSATAGTDISITRLFAGRTTMTREELYRAALAADASIEFITDIYLLPDGIYAPADVRRAISGDS